MTLLLAQLILSGLVLGAIYALIALGYVIIYKATSVVNFAQGEAVMVGAYIGLSVYSFMHLPVPLVFAITMAVAALLGVIIERVAYRRLVGAPVISLIIATLAVGLILRNVVRLIFGPNVYPFPPLIANRPLRFAGLVTTPQNLLILSVSVTCMVLLFLYFQFTKWGKAMRAVSQNGTAAVLMGISVRKVFSMIWALSAALGALAGVLLAPLLVVNPDMGWIALKAFVVAILGGFQSLPGAVLGGFALGILENLAGFYIGSAVKDIVAYVVLIAILIARPTGLFAERTGKRV
jgi:branched-chain amino acid transport system permease protein